MIFGYGVLVPESMPAQFQQALPGTRVLNMAVNGQEMGSSYLIGKAIIDSVDTIYVQMIGEKANPMIASLIPVDSADLRRFKVEPPDPIEQRLRRALSRVWRLYGTNERIQAAIFGTSTRQYLYLHKGEMIRRVLRGPAPVPPARTWPPLADPPTLRAPRATSVPSPERQRALRERLSVQWDFAMLARARNKRVVFLDFEWRGGGDMDAYAAEFNAAHAPHAELAIIKVPPALTYDGQHLTAEGSHAVGELLAAHHRRRVGERSGS